MAQIDMGTVEMVATLALGVARLTVFALALGLTLISFRAYREKKSDRLESAFIGFAFLSMGVALTTLSTQMETWTTIFELVETIPLVIGFSMLYISLYR